MNCAAWFSDAIFYEIYPQTFYDANGDGIGDIEGIIQKLDYIADLGFNAIWLNPCFDSPFKDAGYDIRDYKKVAPRYGTNDCLKRLFASAHERGMHVLLDLVPGHTSEEHEWFQKSKGAQKNEYWNRYIWTDNWGTWVNGLKTIYGESERNAVYIVNFFKSQPALNYGFADPDQVWQLPPSHPDCVATLEALKDIMRFWLDMGCDGYRADMAFSLVKFDDAQNSQTCAIWRNVRAMLEREYPNAALVSEWSNPERALKCGFDADFFLAFYDNSGYQSLFRGYTLDSENRIIDKKADYSFFKKDAESDIMRFLDDYLPRYEAAKNDGFISLCTGNHDLPRLSYTLSDLEKKIAYTFLFTMPGIPFLYYGDEIGMRYLHELPTKEGGYTRTGSRTPMQWQKDAPNRGFSTAAAEKLYLPPDAAPDAPAVDEQQNDPDSLLNTVKRLLALRKSEKDLGAVNNLEILYAKKGILPFVYKRGRFIAAFNPAAEKAASCTLDECGIAPSTEAEEVFEIGKPVITKVEIVLPPQSCGIWKFV